MQKYPSGSRGSPAKGVASLSVARVQISSSAPKNGQDLFLSVFWRCSHLNSWWVAPTGGFFYLSFAFYIHLVVNNPVALKRYTVILERSDSVVIESLINPSLCLAFSLGRKCHKVTIVGIVLAFHFLPHISLLS